MIIHKIHDLSNIKIVDLLKKEFSKIDNVNFLENYHPDYSNKPANIFYILQNTNRYKNGAYYILENNGEYVLSTGWNEYEYKNDIALIITRLYISQLYRSKLLMSKYILPMLIEETQKYKHTYVTVNKYNKNLLNSFLRVSNKKILRNQYSMLYKNLEYKGIMNIYFTEQHVLEYKRC